MKKFSIFKYWQQIPVFINSLQAEQNIFIVQSYLSHQPRKRSEDNFRDLWDNVKHPNIRIIGVPEEEDKKKSHEKMRR